MRRAEKACVLVIRRLRLSTTLSNWPRPMSRRAAMTRAIQARSASGSARQGSISPVSAGCLACSQPGHSASDCARRPAVVLSVSAHWPSRLSSSRPGMASRALGRGWSLRVSKAKPAKARAGPLRRQSRQTPLKALSRAAKRLGPALTSCSAWPMARRYSPRCGRARYHQGCSPGSRASQSAGAPGKGRRRLSTAEAGAPAASSTSWRCVSGAASRRCRVAIMRRLRLPGA